MKARKIKVEKGFIQIDEFQQTAEKGVYAIGDVVPTPLLAHLASKEGIVAVEHMAGEKMCGRSIFVWCRTALTAILKSRLSV